MWIEIATFIILCWIIYYNYLKKPSDYPPGPWGLPLIGCLPFKSLKFDGMLEELRKKHGQIYSMRIGSRVVVFLAEFKTIKEALQNPAFAFRPDIKVFMSLLEDGDKYGVIGTNGTHWKNIRRFMLRHLRDLGMGKSRIASSMYYEAIELVQLLKKQAGKAAPFPKTGTPAFLNVVWQMVASKRYELEDQELLDFQNVFFDFEKAGIGMMILDICPWLKSVVPKPILDYLVNRKFISQISGTLKSIIMKFIIEHQKTLDSDHPRDFIDDYLIEMEKQKDDPDSEMSIDDLAGCVADLFAGGLETISISVRWMVLYLANFPEVQKKLQEEVDEALPKGTPFTWEDKPRLPYFEAFINESIRYSNLSPFSGFHAVPEDTVFEGYRIPKGAIVLPMTGAINFDSKYFDTPEEFRPERFLNSDGKYAVPTEAFIPFGIGKRTCLAEALARMELFVFITTFVQHLEFSPPENGKINLTPENIPILNLPRVEEEILITIRNV